MKILYLAHRIPYPPNKGDKIRSFNQVKYLAATNELDLICLVDDPQDLPGEEALSALCRRVHVCKYNPFQAKLKGLLSVLKGDSISGGYFYNTSVQNVFDQWLLESDYDAIICFSSPMAEYLFKNKTLTMGRASASLSRPQLVMDFCDVDSDKWLQYAENAKFPVNILYRAENKRLAAYEQKVYQAFDQSLLVSGKEKELFAKVCSDTAKVTIVRNGVDYEYFSPKPDDKGIMSLIDSPPELPEKSGKQKAATTIVFTGAMDYHANVDGVCWFCLKVLPKVQAKIPDLKFLIVGSNPTESVRALGRLPGVEVTGFVDDIRTYYQLADLCVVPLRLARGVQNKVLEAMAMGKAVVTTSKANDGVQAQDGVHLLVADRAEDFINCTLKLLYDADLREKLSSSARGFVVNQYDWQVNMEALSNLLQEQRLYTAETKHKHRGWKADRLSA